MAHGSEPLVCSHFTLTGSTSLERPRFGFAERVAAAAAAGFSGIGLLGFDHQLALHAGLTDLDLTGILFDHDVELAEVEFLMDWSAGPEEPERVAAARILEDQVWAVADVFGPRVVSVGEVGPPEQLPPFDLLAERFGALCDRAAAHGLLVALEFLPWSGIPDIAAAAALVEAVGRPNAGINLDAWHWFRGNPSAEVLRAVADRIFVLQLDAADRTAVGSLPEDTTLRRRRRRADLGRGDVDRALRVAGRGGRAPCLHRDACSHRPRVALSSAWRARYSATASWWSTIGSG